ncbi:glutaredoxin family protein [Thalassotalea sp. LPB0316]|uniref:glutaredoxin family protein n=1 Tax=Thalassotalea sp. LPB0316 TaxID=2769490 RepID=UPI001868A2BE|nr:glutaredoxin family protein [Thalassotalea sp. LPB0316]QOL24932.1 glutaredoxin family protein [Thalassotalea sp. LPB0316]
MQQEQYYLYSSVGCHLCEQALQLCLTQLSSGQIRVVDILDDDDKEPEQKGSLYDKYGVSIPVLKCLANDRELFWPFDELALQEFLA